jgi:hypothetical protein
MALTYVRLQEAPWMVRKASTTLKYAVEVEIPRATAMVGLVESLLERVVYQDIPANLGAIKRRVEQLQAAAGLAREQSRGPSPQPLCPPLSHCYMIIPEKMRKTFTHRSHGIWVAAVGVDPRF